MFFPRATAGRAALLTSLYFAQGLPFGLFTQALPVMMRQQGYSLESIGLANLLALPWALKFLWAPWIDRVSGPRRRVIVPLNVVAAGLLSALAVVSPGAMIPLIITVFLCNLAAATQDIATDGLAVESLPPAERGLGNGVQVAGYRLGMVVGGGALVQLFDAKGWMYTFFTAAFAITVATLPLLFVSPPDRPAPGAPASGRDALRWDRWFAGRDGLAWFGLLILYKLGDSFGTSMVKPMFVDQGLSLGEIGALIGLRGSIAGMVGALVGGWFVGKWRRRAALAVFAALQVPTLALYAWLAVAGPAHAAEIVVVEHLFSGMATAALFTAMMDACRPGHAGSDYTVQASVVVLAQGLGGIASGFSAHHFGYPAHMAVATGLSVVAAGYVLVIRRGEGRFLL
ncbi:MFS transporter [Deltaproteobacteria bacterium]|nr:MFS transporter [Deltaproteobacteria bacterium]